VALTEGTGAIYRYLRSLGVVVSEEKAALSPTEALLARYRSYLVERGVRPLFSDQGGLESIGCPR
jgi:hypothetical protein